MHSVSVTVPSSAGLKMAGTIDLPDTKPIAWAIFSHCFTGSRFTVAASRVCKTLAESGIACLRFDYPGLGQSEGDFKDTCFSSNVEDLVCAYNWLAENYEAPKLLIGHSLGGSAALKAGPRMPAVKAVATMGSPFDPAHAVLLFADHVSEADANGSVQINIGGREVTISRQYLEDMAEINPETYIGKLRRPLLILHSPVDQVVGIDSAQKIFITARYPKSLVAVDGADHMFTRAGSAQRVANIIRTWADEYLTRDAEEEDVLPEGVARSQTIPAGRFTDIVRIDGEAITTDRERTLGGKGLGLSPTSLLISSLAAATSQAIRLAAKDNGIRTLDDVEVEVSRVVGSPEHATTLRRSIALKGDLTDEQRATLLAAADNSCIHKIITGSSTIIETRQ